MNHIELFSGCGGMSLGMKKAGFELLLANELSPMAAETFAYNFLNEDLDSLSSSDGKPKKTLWLSSHHQSLKPRLRENPFLYPHINESSRFHDLPQTPDDLKGKLLVGSIIELNKLLDSDPELLKTVRSGFNQQGVDLVSGGPPCQSFSLAGLRKQDCDKNTLPWEFAEFVSKVSPKVVILENVSGILRAFKDDSGTSFHAWFEVAKVFATKGYVPLCLHVNARLAGVAQNRPRFIMLALRKDVFDHISATFKPDSAELSLFSPSHKFYNLIQISTDKVSLGDLPYFDASKPNHRKLYENSFLNPLISCGHEVSVKEALDDLKFTSPSLPSKFILGLNSTFKKFLKTQDSLKNHDKRNNSPLVQRRFRIYQVLQKIDDRKVHKAVFNILKGLTIELPEDIWECLKEHTFLLENGQLAHFISKDSFINYLQSHPTKKQTQRALISSSPAPAALSIPDDACHYDHSELRVLTVREMARIQSFPDDFVFRSKTTTGGQMRKYEVPQYTQVGNAVPPLLALALGKVVKHLLEI